MTDFEAQLKKLYEESVKFLGDHKTPPMADGPEKDALGQIITSSSLLDLINTPYAEMLLPKIRDPQLPINERVGFVARLTIQVLHDMSGEIQYQRLLDAGMSPEEIERLSFEIASGRTLMDQKKPPIIIDSNLDLSAAINPKGSMSAILSLAEQTGASIIRSG